MQARYNGAIDRHRDGSGESTKMPWEQSFDQNVALDTTMQVFREKGSESTAIAEEAKRCIV